MHLTTRLAGALAGSALTLGVLAAAPAVAGEPVEPCAKQQQKVDDAEAALERVTAVFERQKDKVEKARRQKDEADTPREEKAADRALERAKDGREEARKDKKAQKQRLARAEDRLEDCRAEQA